VRFAVYIGGAWEGFNTPVSGEGRYAYNLSQMLAERGHKVDCIGTGTGAQEPPLWGTQKPIEGISFIHPNNIDRNITYNAALNLPWHSDDCRAVNARMVAHTCFNWMTDKSPAIKNCRHLIFHPYPNQLKNDNLRLVPFPFYSGLASTNFVKGRKTVVWACKDVFVDEWGAEQAFHSPAAKMLKALCNVANKCNLDCIFISAKSFSSNLAQSFGVPEILNGFRSITLIEDKLLKEELDSYLSLARIVPILPNYGASCFDAAALGAIPIFYKETEIFAEFFPSAPKISISDTPEEIAAFIERIFTDDEYYLILIEKIRKDIELYSYESSYQHLMKVLEEFS